MTDEDQTFLPISNKKCRVRTDKKRVNILGASFARKQNVLTFVTDSVAIVSIGRLVNWINNIK